MGDTASQDNLHAWRARAQKETGLDDVEQALLARTLEGLDVPALRADRPASVEEHPLHTRGPLWPRAPWITPYHDHPDPTLLAEHLADDFSGGAQAAWLDIERAGLFTHDELDSALEHYDLTERCLIVQGGAAPAAQAGWLSTWLTRQGFTELDVDVYLALDPLAAWARTGRLPGPWDKLLAETVDVLKGLREAPVLFASIAVDGVTSHRAGAHHAQCLAYVMSATVEYLRACEAGKLSPDQAAGHFVWRLPLGKDLLTNLASLRAAHLLWTKLLGACGVKHPPQLSLHAVTSPRILASRDAYTNLLRNTHACAAALMGGVTFLTPAEFDRPLRQPQTLGRRLARHTPLILMHESRLHETGDPLGGSYELEHRTTALARLAWDAFRDLEKHGGFAKCLQDGRLATQLAESRDALRTRLTSGEENITGVTAFDDEAPEALARDGDQAVAWNQALEKRRASARADKSDLKKPAATFAFARKAADGGAPWPRIDAALKRGKPGAAFDALPVVTDEGLATDTENGEGTA